MNWLEDKKERDFHMDMERFLLPCKILRPDVHPEVEFLIPRVKDPTNKYLKNIVRVLEYLKGIPEECLVLSMEYTKLIKWWVDGSYAVHIDMSSHTGEMISMRKGVMYYTPQK